MSAPQLFGVSAATLSTDYFGHAPAFSGSSVPTDTRVAVFISGRASRLDAALRAADITPASVAADATSAAYLWCADLVSLDSAIRCVHAGMMQDPDVVKAWRAEVEARYKDLAERGAEVLGSGAAEPTVEALGPNDHISDDNLETEDVDDISPVTHKLRVSDVM